MNDDEDDEWENYIQSHKQLKSINTAFCIAATETIQLEIQLLKQLQEPTTIHSVTVKDLTKHNITWNT